MDGQKKGLPYWSILRIGVLEVILVLAGMVFVRREVYMRGQFSSLLLDWQDYALLVICFADGIVHGAFDLRGPAHYVSPFRRKVLRLCLPAALFLYVSCAALSAKLNAAAVQVDWVRDLGLCVMVLALAFGIWARLTMPTFMLKSDAPDEQQTFPAELKADVRGPWCWLRYPDRSAILLMLFGLSLAIGSWLPLLTLPGVFVVFKWELADLESFRISQIGAPYLAYRSSSWCLLPYIY